MEISLLPHRVQAADLPLEQLSTNKNVPEEEKVGELSRQFEALLLRQILKDVKKSVIKSDLTRRRRGVIFTRT